MAHRRGNPATVFKPTSEYFQWVRAGDLIFTAGVIPVDVNRKLVGAGDIEAQTRQVLKNIGLILEDAGARWADVVKLNTYLSDLSTIERMRAARRAFFAEAGVVEYPAANALEIHRLGTVGGVLIEVEAIAVVPH